MLKFSLILLLFIEGYNCYSYDCGSSTDNNVRVIEIGETAKEGTPIARFNSTYGALQWTASVNGTNVGYLSRFFHSQPVVKGMSSDVSTVGPEPVINAQTLVVAKVLDLELLEVELPIYAEYSTADGDLSLDLDVSCKDANGQWKRTSIELVIRAVNEFVPLFVGAPYKRTLSEIAEIGDEIISMAALVNDMDAGQTHFVFGIAPYQISQFDGSHYVSVSADGHVTLARPIDYEALPAGRSYMFLNITVQDDGGLTSVTSINVTITDANDLGVQFVYPDCGRPCLVANFTVFTNESYTGELLVQPVPFIVEDLDALAEPVIYDLVNDVDRRYFRVDTQSGRLYQTAPLVNDTYTAHIPLLVRGMERSRSDHYIETNISVVVEDRLRLVGPVSG